MTKGLSVLCSKWFVVPSLFGTLVMAALQMYGTLPTQIATTGTFLSIVAGLLMALVRQIDELRRSTTEQMRRLGVVLPALADTQLHIAFRRACEALSGVAVVNHRVHRSLATERVNELTLQMRQVAEGRLVYRGTEAWRNAYAEILTQADVRTYRSVSLIRSLNYWQDQPGQQSLDLNRQLAAGGLRISRIVIMRDREALDEAGQVREPLRSWLTRQAEAGIELLTISESALSREPDLLIDIGLYDSHAVGILETNRAAETERFTLSFHGDDVRAYGAKWERLQLYAKSWSSS